MTEAMGPWGRYELGRHLSLGMRDREIVIDRTCCPLRLRVRVGRARHVLRGSAAFHREQVASLTHGSRPTRCWTDDRDRLLVEAVDRLHDRADLGEELWRRLAAVFSEAELLDLTMLCGWYHAISFTANAARASNGRPSSSFWRLRKQVTY